MRIREFSLLRYGILPSLPRMELEKPLVLVWGPNEQGKTMLLEALLKMLLGTSRAVMSTFPYLNRVEGMPEGFVMVEGLGEKPVRFPDKKSLHEMLGLTPEEFRNLFVVRDSDLVVRARAGKGPDFYARISERTRQITGMRASDIATLRAKLLDLARLTPELRFRDVQGEKLRSRLNRAWNLLKRMDALLEEARAGGVETLERTYTRLKVRLEDLERQKELLERAGRWEQIRLAEAHLRRLESIREALVTLAHLREEDLRRWGEIRRDLVRTRDDLNTLEEKVEKLRKERVQVVKQRGVLRQEYEKQRNRLQAVREALVPLMQDVRSREERLARHRVWDRAARGLVLGSSVLLGLSLVGWMVRDDPVWLALSGLFLGGAALGGLGVWRGLRERSVLEGARRRLSLEAVRLGLQVVTLEDTERAIAGLEGVERDLGRQEAALEQALKDLDRRIQDLEREIREKVETKKRLLEEEEDLAHRSGLETPAAYQEKLRQKQALEAEERAKLGALEGLLGPLPSGADPREHYQGVLSRLRREAGDPPAIPFDQARLQEVNDAIRETEEALIRLGKEMERFREALREVAREANEVLQPEHPYPCESLAQLEEVRKKVQAFVDRHRILKERVQKILAILERMEEEEKEKVKDLLGPESEVSRRFARVTGGRYAGVFYDQDQGDIRVKTARGEVLTPDQLSGGTFDQLYFVVRTVLGEGVLQGQAGFFFLDDPFVKADPDRLRALGGLLLDLVRRGWQVLYFSSKGEILDLFRSPAFVEHVQLVNLRERESRG